MRGTLILTAAAAALGRLTDSGLPVIAGVLPLESVRHAEFLNNEVPGTRVPDTLMERLRSAAGPDAARREGIAIARDVIAALLGRVSGVQVSTLAGDAGTALQVLDGLR